MTVTHFPRSAPTTELHPSTNRAPASRVPATIRHPPRDESLGQGRQVSGTGTTVSPKRGVIHPHLALCACAPSPSEIVSAYLCISRFITGQHTTYTVRALSSSVGWVHLDMVSISCRHIPSPHRHLWTGRGMKPVSAPTHATTYSPTSPVGSNPAFYTIPQSHVSQLQRLVFKSFTYERNAPERNESQH